MNRLVLAAIASILALAVIAFAIASASDDDNDDEGVMAPTATATTVPPTLPPVATATTQAPTRPTLSPDQPVSSTPGASPQPAPTTTQIPLPRHTEPAPIDGVDVLTLESFPPQYMLHVQAGLPSGCAQKHSHEVLPRQGNVIQVVVLNSVPDAAICTAIYGMYELNINLGSDFTSGQTYTVRVNERQVQFTAQ